VNQAKVMQRQSENKRWGGGEIRSGGEKKKKGKGLKKKKDEI